MAAPEYLQQLAIRPRRTAGGEVLAGAAIGALLGAAVAPKRSEGAGAAIGVLGGAAVGALAAQPVSLGEALKYAATALGLRLVSWRRIGPVGARVLVRATTGYRSLTSMVAADGTRVEVDDRIYFELVHAMSEVAE